MTDLIARCARHGWTLRKDGDGWELLGNGAPAAFGSEESVRVWLDKQRTTMGVPKQMPDVGAKSAHQHVHTRGVQSYRNGTPMTDSIKAPFPWPGGKSDMAPAVWSRFGTVDNFVEPLCGSAAMLLSRPGGAHGTETVNDVDGLLINAYRCIQFSPDETAAWCDWPVSEADLTSRHLYLKASRDELTARLFADPAWCDPQAGGWWLWGIASWIGDGWCVADGPWINVDGRLVDRRIDGASGAEHPCQMPKMDHESTPLQSYRASVPRKMPEIGRSPNGQMAFNRKGVQAYRHHEGVPRKMPEVGATGVNRKSTARPSERGVHSPSLRGDSALAAYFARLSDRLRRVRFLCGDWRRAVKDSVTVNHGLTGCFIDSPYPQNEHSMGYHSEGAKGDEDVWFQSARWAAEHGDDKRFRIAVCGYMSPACDAMFPPTWERLPWEARGGYANQSKDGRGRTNAKREMIWFSPNCIDSKTDYGPLFAGIETGD